MYTSKAKCLECGQDMRVLRMGCSACGVSMEGDFEVSALGQLSLKDQTFVMAFVRHHGSIKKMESLFEISYPTVKNRLNSIAAALDKRLEAPSPNMYVLEQLARGEISTAEALEKLSGGDKE